jgi:division protein 1
VCFPRRRADQDTVQGVQDRLSVLDLASNKETTASGRPSIATSRRRKGPAFLPSDHDQLPPNVAFMTLQGHSAPIAALDFSEPYGLLVTAAGPTDETVRLWDLTSGEERAFLRGHVGPVKALQVESSLCVTGGKDGMIKIWDLEIAEQQAEEAAVASLTEVAGDATEDDIPRFKEDAACIRTLEAHTKDVTCLYFDGNCLVRSQPSYAAG